MLGTSHVFLVTHVFVVAIHVFLAISRGEKRFSADFSWRVTFFSQFLEAIHVFLVAIRSRVCPETLLWGSASL